MWQVILVKAPHKNDYRADYFPRKFHYRSNAEVLRQEIEQKGGAARIEKVASRTSDGDDMTTAL